MLEFEKENGQLKRFAENGQQERAEIMAKLKQLSGQIRTLTDENEGNKVEKEVLKKELAEYRSDKEKMEKEMDILNKALDQRVEANLAELASCREKIAQLEETVRVSAREIDDSHAMNESNLKKLTQLSDKLEQVIEEKKRYEAEVSKFEEKNDVQSNSIRSNSIITSKDQELFSLREELERAHIETEKLKNQNESRAAESESLAKQLLALQENTKELMDRISQGEDGSKTAIEQLKGENQKLQEEIGQLTASFREEVGVQF
ncbi:hypothetical protein OSTOST_19232 [Ostertagia ostertagi]